MALTTMVYAQQPPQGTPGPGAFWRQGGNVGGPGAPNIFGTAGGNNNPIYTYTNGLGRMKLNGSLNYAVDGINEARSGYLLLGNNVPINNNLFNNANYGAFSMLHLAGRDGGFVQDFGYRSWMKTGITLTDNQDLSYIGLRQVGDGFDKTETTITWADNTDPINGPDDLVFRFTGFNSNGSAQNVSTNLFTGVDLDDLHIARYTGDGLMGLFGTPLDDGWGDWMDVGTFTAQDSDNMYVGLKREAGTTPLVRIYRLG